LIEFFQEPRVELYDLKHDLGEEHDLSRSSPKMARLAESLRRRLAAWRRSVRAGMMTLNPGFVSDRRGD
jgi:hypothetical protein